jgi:hypothetical protein
VASNGNAPGCKGGQGQGSSDETTNTETYGWKDRVHAALTSVSVVFQDVATIASSIGTSFEIAGLATGGPPGFAAGTALHMVSTNIVETATSWVSTGATVIDGFVTGENRINKEGIVINEASATSLVTSSMGLLIQVATIDVQIDMFASNYNHGTGPGIYELINSGLDFFR